MSVRSKFIASQIAVVALLAAAIGAVTYTEMRSNLLSVRKQQLELQAKSIRAAVEQRISELSLQAERLATSQAFVEYAATRDDDGLKHLFSRQTDDFRSVSYVNEDFIEEVKYVLDKESERYLHHADNELVLDAFWSPNSAH